MTQGQLQLGKNGVTDNFIETVRSHFKKHNNVKIKVLKSVGRDKKRVKEISDEIIGKLGNNYTSKIVGFSLFLKKWRKSKTEESSE